MDSFIFLARKEGNITRSNNTKTNNLALTGSQGNQIMALLPPREASGISPADALLPREGSSLSQATALLPKESSPSQVIANLPWWKEAILPRSVLTFPPGKEVIHPRQV